MKTVTVKIEGKKLSKNYEVKLFSSIKELPITRKHELNKLVAQKIDIGDNPSDIARHLKALYKYVMGGYNNEAILELKNMHNNMFYAIEGIDIDCYCFAAMIHSVDGKEFTDLSLEGSKAMADWVTSSTMTNGEVEEIVIDVKKNLIPNYQPSFLIDLEEEEQLMSSAK
jgi:hypothetical protein